MLKLQKIRNLKLIVILSALILLFLGVITYIKTYGDITASFDTESGISNDVVYVNDSKSDYNYYMGLNYTYSSDGKIPTTANKNIYNDQNLVPVTITYNGNGGYVSLNERQTTYVYYKYFPVNNNGTADLSDDYIDIELIDNPFTDRPNNKGFNGWISNYLGAVIRLESDIYTRYAKIPVTYENSKPQALEITFEANWIEAKTSYISNTNSLASSISAMNDPGLIQIAGTKKIYEDVSNYFNRYRTEYNTYYPDGAVDSRNRNIGRRRCRSYNGCTYYMRASGEYNSTLTYYRFSGETMNVYEIVLLSVEEIDFPVGVSVTGYYHEVEFSDGESIKGYYDKRGIIQNDGFCANSCIYYELIQYYDSAGNVSVPIEGDNYYYLVTRDTNIIIVNRNVSNGWGSNYNKPFILTSVYNGVNYINSVYWSIEANTINAYSDMVIENIRIYSTSSRTTEEMTPGETSDGSWWGGEYYSNFYGNWHNIKFGRGIVAYSNNYVNFAGVIGGNTSTTGSINNVIKYKLIIESGFYNSLALSSGNNSSTKYINGIGVYGNDYDRVTQNNSFLDVRHCASGSWSGDVYSSNEKEIALLTTVKSGSFGSNKYDYATGIYVGGRGGGTHYAPRSIIIEGGYIYNLIGGPLTASSRRDKNDILMYIKGGSIDVVIGGAGVSETYGNRIVQMTGGQVNYSLFGGSNGIAGSNQSNRLGTLDSDTYVYVGGLAIVGAEELVNNNVVESNSKIEAGSVFGIGNGKEGANFVRIGSANNSNVIIADTAIIHRNVYAGGNYGAVGINLENQSTVSNISINGGLIKGSVYGGGNNNGSGSSTTQSTVNISMKDGMINGSIYGGANQLGTIYGSTNLHITGGLIKTSIYGGGQGGKTGSALGTFVSESVNVIIGNDETGPTINNNIYGGSAFGSVNGTTQTNNVSNYNTQVVVNNGNILGSVFGGGEGNNIYNPYVMGNVDVKINGGNINNVFGGNDEAGTPNGYVKLYLNGGIVKNAYGGGNNTGVDTTNVYLKGSKTTSVFGGSNISGNSSTTMIHAISGSAETIYGGNNQGGMAQETNIIVDGGIITTIYGGGKLATTTKTNIFLNAAKITNVYGGGEAADILDSTNIKLQGSIVTNIYGGSNRSGSVPVTNIQTVDGSVDTIYGGNNQGGVTTTSNINVDSAKISNIFGGGDQANTTTSNVNINETTDTIKNVYGGGNAASVDDTNIIVNGGNFLNIYGGSNVAGVVNNSNIDVIKENIVNNGNITAIVNWSVEPDTWRDQAYPYLAKIQVTLTNNTSEGIDNWTFKMKSLNSKLFSNYSQAKITNENATYVATEIGNYYGTNVINANSSFTFEFEILTMQNEDDFSVGYSFKTLNNSFVIKDNITIDNLYGGNNQGGQTNNTDLNIKTGIIGNLYGGGNQAKTGKTKVYLENALITNDLYGGGNQAIVETTTDVDVISSTAGDVFGGGNAGRVDGTTDVYISDSNITNSVYAGGNGTTAIVNGNTILNIDGTTIIQKHIFGGGNAAATGSAGASVSSIVNIAGGKVLGNVYGGANTSVINGYAKVNIGTNAVTTSLKKGNIDIKGTVFGGGEANAGGSQIFDWNFISVTKGIDVLIDGSGHDTFNIGTSIFGSGNASSSSGTSNVTIKNYGTLEDYKYNISIQRANNVVIDNSVIELEGIADRTNELFSDVPFTIARVDNLKVKNGTILYLKTNTNLLKAFTSLVDVNGNEEIATLTIQDGEVVKNVDNRLYVWESKNINILTDIAGTSYGKVTGMTFFGMFNHDRDGKIVTGMYSKTYQNGSTISSNILRYFSDGAYVMGLHSTNHNIKIDGFYTNYENEESKGTIKVDYIDPTALGDNCYKWVVGAPVLAYEIEDLKASKYSTLGTVELPLTDFSAPNTKFYVEGFAYNELDPTISLVDSSDVPRIASTSEIADTVMSLVMESSNLGWLTKGATTFKTDGNLPTGTLEYDSENSNVIPTLLFYLYHSKNLSTTARLGSVKILLKVETPIDAISSKFTDLNIIVNLSRALINTIDYEGALTAGKKYEMFPTTTTNITAKSSISTYFSLYAESSNNFYKEGYHRTLISNFVFPEKTKITMIDYGKSSLPEYYYYVVDASDVARTQIEFNQYGEVTYDFAKFIKMGSSSPENHYDDAVANAIYYNSESKVAEEEFIFIVDYGEANITEDKSNIYLLMELQNANSQVLVSVLAQQRNIMLYNIYYNSDAIIKVNASLSNPNLYVGNSTTLNVETNFVQPSNIYDTSYFDKKLGIKLSLYDSNGNQVTGADLMGIAFKNNDISYHPRLDGTIRFNLAERVANVSSNITIDALNSNLASGKYTLKIESFASADGIYYGLVASDLVSLELNVVDTIYGLKATMRDELMFIDSLTGKTQLDNNVIVLNIEYASGLTNPNIRLTMYRRDYTAITTSVYNKVDMQDYFTNSYKIGNELEYIVSTVPTANFNLYLYFKDNLKTGTYKLVFSLYDGNVYVGDIYKYIIIK